jgi:hypothetical protein
MFFIAGFKFLVRVVMLWFSIVTAPIAFAAHAMPQNKRIKSYYDTWQRLLFESAFYPAVFLFLFYIDTLFTGTLAGTNGLIPSIFAQVSALKGSPGGVISIIANVAIRMGMVIVLLHYTMKLADSFSEAGSGAARSILGWAGGKIAGSTAGTAGWIGRNTLGRGANAAANSASMKNFEGKSVFARPVMATLRGVAGSSFDARGSQTLNSTLSRNGVNVGKARGQGGFVQTVRNRSQNVAQRAQALKADQREITAAQAGAEKEYDQKNGAGAYRREISRLETLRQAAVDPNTRSITKPEDHKKLDIEAAGYTNKIREMENMGRTRVADLEKQRIGKFLDRVGERNWQNLGNIKVPGLTWLTGPSRGSLEGVAQARVAFGTKENGKTTPVMRTPIINVQKPIKPVPPAIGSEDDIGRVTDEYGPETPARQGPTPPPAREGTDADINVDPKKPTPPPTAAIAPVPPPHTPPSDVSGAGMAAIHESLKEVPAIVVREAQPHTQVLPTAHIEGAVAKSEKAEHGSDMGDHIEELGHKLDKLAKERGG